ncbi:Amino acid permease domain containing protein [Elaphomyces granulatus]
MAAQDNPPRFEPQEPEDHTQLRRNLGERHVNMIAFSAVVGIGFFLQAGSVVYYAGPGLAVFAYLISGTVTWSAMACLGEMTALFPVKGAIFDFPGRFLDEAVGYAVGWMAWYFQIMIVAVEVLAVSQLFNFQFKQNYLSDVGYPESVLEWAFGQNTNPAVWGTLVLIIMFIVNLLPVRAFGEVEYISGCCKMIFICLLILLNVVINSNSVDSSTPPLFKYYNPPFAFESQNFTVHGDQIFTGGPGHLASMWTAMTVCIFGMAGFETVSIVAAESRDLERDESIKLATRKIALRIILLYALATFTVGLNVPYTDPNLNVSAINSFSNGQNSIFIIAVVRAHLTGWPHFLNAFFIFSSTSAGINALYLASRLLHALASIPGAWPRWTVAMTLRGKLEQTVYGVPVAAVFASWLFGLLGFLSVNPSSAEILGRIATNAVVSTLIVNCLICGAYLQFYKCVNRAARGDDERIDPDQDLRAYDRDDDRFYPYRSHGQYLRAWYGMCGSFLIVLFNGWSSFVSPMSNDDFLASYINIPIFIVLILAYRVKLEGFNPLNWTRRAREDLHNPLSIAQRNPRLRRGRLRRANRDVLFSWENAERFIQWLWTWLK